MRAAACACLVWFVVCVVFSWFVVCVWLCCFTCNSVVLTLFFVCFCFLRLNGVLVCSLEFVWVCMFSVAFAVCGLCYSGYNCGLRGVWVEWFVWFCGV